MFTQASVRQDPPRLRPIREIGHLNVSHSPGLVRLAALIVAIACAALLGLSALGAGGGAEARDARLTGPEIVAALSDWSASYVSGARQYFDAAGVTWYLEEDGRRSRGRWRVRDDQYCSVWPPSAVWICFDVEKTLRDGRVRVDWIGESGRRYPAEMTPGREAFDQ